MHIHGYTFYQFSRFFANRFKKKTISFFPSPFNFAGNKTHKNQSQPLQHQEQKLWVTVPNKVLPEYCEYRSTSLCIIKKAMELQTSLKRADIFDPHSFKAINLYKPTFSRLLEHCSAGQKHEEDAKLRRQNVMLTFSKCFTVAKER